MPGARLGVSHARNSLREETGETFFDYDFTYTTRVSDRNSSQINYKKLRINRAPQTASTPGPGAVCVARASIVVAKDNLRGRLHRLALLWPKGAV